MANCDQDQKIRVIMFWIVKLKTNCEKLIHHTYINS